MGLHSILLENQKDLSRLHLLKCNLILLFLIPLLLSPLPPNLPRLDYKQHKRFCLYKEQCLAHNRCSVNDCERITKYIKEEEQVQLEKEELTVLLLPGKDFKKKAGCQELPEMGEKEMWQEPRRGGNGSELWGIELPPQPSRKLRLKKTTTTTIMLHYVNWEVESTHNWGFLGFIQTPQCIFN